MSCSICPSDLHDDDSHDTVRAVSAPPKDAQKAFADYWPYGISDDIDVFKRDVYDAWCAAWRAATAAAHEADAKLAEHHDVTCDRDHLLCGLRIAAAIRSRAEEAK